MEHLPTNSQTNYLMAYRIYTGKMATLKHTIHTCIQAHCTQLHICIHTIHTYIQAHCTRLHIYTRHTCIHTTHTWDTHHRCSYAHSINIHQGWVHYSKHNKGQTFPGSINHNTASYCSHRRHCLTTPCYTGHRKSARYAMACS